MAKKKKKNHMSRFIIVSAMLAFSVFAIYKIIGEIQTTLVLNKSLSLTKQQQQSLEDQKKELEQEKENLNNVEYIVRYARHKYMQVKENGEQVFELPTDDK